MSWHWCHHTRVFVELAIPCEKPGPRVFKGFTVGFHARSWEIVRICFFLSYVYLNNNKIFNEDSIFMNLQVYDGMTQLGFEKSHQKFRYEMYIVN